MTTSFPAISLPSASPSRPRADPRRLFLLFGGLVILVIVGAAAWLLVELSSVFATDPSFADWRGNVQLAGLAAVAAAVGIVALLIYVHRLFDRFAATNAALRNSEEATRRQAEILSTLTENLPIGVALVGSDMRYLAFNRLFLDQSGLPPDAFKVGDSVEKLVRLLAERGEAPPDGREMPVEERVSHRLTERRAGQAAQFERRRTDGRVIDVRIVPLPDGGFVSTRIDVTEKRKIEQQLIHAQKMEAIGNLTGGLAHDFNNLLGIIMGNLDLARPLLKSSGSAEELVGEALDAATRGAELTRRLLAFAKRQTLRPELINVNELVAKTIKLVGRTLGDNIAIAFEPASEVWPISADPAQLESAIINLVNNARDAMPLGGHLTIATGNRHLDTDYARAHSEVAPGDYAMIVVSDTGSGIPLELIGRIYEPFFTTKGQENGMGLGLSMVFGFTQQSGGHITVHSTVDIGTTFRLFLPRERTAAQVPKLLASPVVTSGGEKVLVVEDNTALRRVVTRQLKELGYRIVEADSADAAYAFLEHDRADMLFTDIVLPGLANGFTLAKSVTERWPRTKILLTSGFPDAKLSDELEALGNVRLLSKPYRKEELARIMREVLDA